MTANLAFDYNCYTKKKTGRVDVLVAVPYDQTMLHLGFSDQGIRPVEEILTNKVYSDQRGGQQGTPVEIQDMGEIHRIQFTLTEFNDTAVQLLRTRAIRGTRTDSVDQGATAGSAITSARPGTILKSDIGQFMMTNRSIRLCLNTTEVEDVRNYWCAIPENPIEYNMGTNVQAVTFGFLCYTAPCGHRKEDILYDNYSMKAYNNYVQGDAVPNLANP